MEIEALRKSIIRFNEFSYLKTNHTVRCVICSFYFNSVQIIKIELTE